MRKKLSYLGVYMLIALVSGIHPVAFADAKSPKGNFSRITVGGLIADNINVKDFGAKGDGVTDDQAAIEKAANAAVAAGKVCYIPKTSANYLIGQTIRVLLVAGQKLNIVSNGATIKPTSTVKNKAVAGLTAFREHVFLAIGPSVNTNAPSMDKVFDNNKGITVTVTGLVFDGSNIPQMAVSPDFNTSIGIGLQISAESQTVTNCQFRNLFGDGYMALGPGTMNCSNNTFTGVGGRGKTPVIFNVDNDHFGDAVNVSAVKAGGKLNITNCQMNGLVFGKRRSRCGITLNFSATTYAVNITGCSINNYAKCLHIEESAVSNTTIRNTIFTNFNIAIANTLNNGSTCSIYDSKIYVGWNNNEEIPGTAQMIVAYKSNAKTQMYNTVLDFKESGVYQGVAPITLFKNCIIKAYNRNVFFADNPDMVFDGCTFDRFGGSAKSFSSCCGTKMNITIKNSNFIGGGKVMSDDSKISVKFLNSKHNISNSLLEGSKN
ncbi:hypothetical protein HHL17_01345 [Chitinophaga sp. G-6-1-13]|uniref:Rhamnogalacturonase A/B/Epimerase-like pectate lyase domain-containing protein n=1 Tax=Chitinophaga fulva TaxID=2728842 RepID=A0A848GIX9_9BACT|nr:glycosyl hydrolase family 28-related protein [Chitinophaga fulva]NML35828.1 hypothetical protein [Chitinophaga fulva]